MLNLKQTKSLVISLIIVINSSALAVSPLVKGQSAPHSGLLFSDTESQELKRNILELDFLKSERENFMKRDKIQSQQIELQKSSIIILNGQKNELLNYNEKLSSQQGYMGLAGFIIGVTLTSVIVWVNHGK